MRQASGPSGATHGGAVPAQWRPRRTLAGPGIALAVCSLAAVGGVTGAAAAATRAGASAASTAGTLRAWGENVNGQLGDGTHGNFSLIPVKVKLPRGTAVTSVRAGCFHTLALTSTGKVLAWGDNENGALGNGTTRSSTTPVRVKLPTGTTVRSVRAGCNFSLALTSAGNVLAWGHNFNGELGTGTTKDSHTPVRVKLPKGTIVTAISAGAESGLALTSTGRVLAWGYNGFGQLGNGTTAESHTPVRVHIPAGVKVSLIAAGADHAFAFSSSARELFGWGDNVSGQLGDGTTTSTDIPERITFLLVGPPPGRLTGLFAGCGHTLAVFSHGAVLAWGDNTQGQLGNGTTTSSDIPVRVMLPAGTTVRAVSAGCEFSLALTSAGRVLAWGDNHRGALGNGTGVSSDFPVPVSLAHTLIATAIGAGPDAGHGLAVVHAR